MIKAAPAAVSEQNSPCWRAVPAWLCQHNHNECVDGAWQVPENKFSLTVLCYVLQLSPPAETAVRKSFATDSRGEKIKKNPLHNFLSVGPRKEKDRVFMVL